MISRVRKPLSAASVLIAAAVLGRSAPADACGGLFCSSPQQPVNQAAEQLIFADNGDGTVTAVIQIQYQGSAPNFSWLLPIPSIPTSDQIGVASNLAFQRLQTATNPQYNLTTRVEGTCGNGGFSNSGGGIVGTSGGSTGGTAAGGTGGGVTVVASGTISVFDYTVIQLDATLMDPADAAINWLKDNKYAVGEGAPGLIRPYLADGLYLLAVKLTNGAEAGSIRPLRITYSSKNPMIPIKLTAVAANDNMGVMTWLLSKAQGVPQNYKSLVLNEARINWFNANSNYNDVVTAAADEAGGQGFVTEFAGPTSNFSSTVWQTYDEQTWQSFQSALYTSFQQIFMASYNNWGSYDGFWDAVRASVTLPTGVSFDDFKLCPTCYSNQIQLSPSDYIKALSTNVVQPMKDVQALITAHPKLTRLYTTMSAAEMTTDPLFTFNQDLPDISNVHTATRVIECNPNVDQFSAPWRIEFANGEVVRGTGSPVGTWPTQLATMPANSQVLQAAESGPGAVLEDNSAMIADALKAYNASYPGSGGSTASSTGSTSTGSTSPGSTTGSTGNDSTAGVTGTTGGTTGFATGNDTPSSGSSHGCSTSTAKAPVNAGLFAIAALALARLRRRSRDRENA